jgi:hypothetical protein
VKEGLFGKYSEDAIYGLVECGELGLRNVLGENENEKIRHSIFDKTCFYGIDSNSLCSISTSNAY